MDEFKCTNCGDCCGPVPVNELEFSRIQKTLLRMPKAKLEKLRNQTRSPLTCMFRDLENNKCGIYTVRPEICKMFGFYEGLVCPANPEHAKIGKKEGANKLLTKEKTKGLLTVQITWDNILKIK